jgi:hypothetical protein
VIRWGVSVSSDKLRLVRTLHRVRPQGRDHSASGLGGEHIGFMPFPTLREQRIASVRLGRVANGSLVS